MIAQKATVLGIKRGLAVFKHEINPHTIFHVEKKARFLTKALQNLGQTKLLDSTNLPPTPGT